MLFLFLFSQCEVSQEIVRRMAAAFSSLRAKFQLPVSGARRQ
jgi:hypothetical protein